MTSWGLGGQRGERDASEQCPTCSSDSPKPTDPSHHEEIGFPGATPTTQLPEKKIKSRLFRFKIFSLAPRKDLFDSSGGFDTFSVFFKY